MGLVDADNTDFIGNNSGPGKSHPCGPKCNVNGVEVDTHCCASPHGGVTGQILADVLKCLDSKGMFPWDAGLPDPFVVLDRHSSRFDPPFLCCINKPLLHQQAGASMDACYWSSMWHPCLASGQLFPTEWKIAPLAGRCWR